LAKSGFERLKFMVKIERSLNSSEFKMSYGDKGLNSNAV
jgi:hypothetical protein